MNPNHSDPPAEFRFQPQFTPWSQRQPSFKRENSVEYGTDEPSGEEFLASYDEQEGSRKRQRPLSVS